MKDRSKGPRPNPKKRVFVDNMQRNITLEHIKMVEQGYEKPDEYYELFKDMQDILGDIDLYQQWKIDNHIEPWGDMFAADFLRKQKDPNYVIPPMPENYKPE